MSTLTDKAWQRPAQHAQHAVPGAQGPAKGGFRLNIRAEHSAQLSCRCRRGTPTQSIKALVGKVELKQHCVSVLIHALQASKEKVAALMQAADARQGRTSDGNLKSPNQTRGWGARVSLLGI